MCVVVLGAQVRVVIPINGLPLQSKLCMNFDNVYFGNNKIFYVHVKMIFMFILNLPFNIWTL